MRETEQIKIEVEDPALSLQERMGIVEAILFVSGNAVKKEEMAQAIGLSMGDLEETIKALDSEYAFDRRGLRLLCFGEHVQMTTRAEYAQYVERVLQPVQKQTLSMAVMETLAVIAYRQPVTKVEIEQIRGVKCDYSIQTLQTKGLIREQGRKETIGRPILYGTTDAFLRHFAISSLDELPAIDHASISNDTRETVDEVLLEDG